MEGLKKRNITEYTEQLWNKSTDTSNTVAPHPRDELQNNFLKQNKIDFPLMLHFFHLRGLKCYLLTYCIINLGQCEMKERIIITMPVTELEINFTGDVVQKVI